MGGEVEATPEKLKTARLVGVTRPVTQIIGLCVGPSQVSPTRSGPSPPFPALPDLTSPPFPTHQISSSLQFFELFWFLLDANIHHLPGQQGGRQGGGGVRDSGGISGRRTAGSVICSPPHVRCTHPTCRCAAALRRRSAAGR